MDTDMFSDTAGKSCLHKIFCFRNTETRYRVTALILRNIVPSSISYCTRLRVQYDILQGTVQYDILQGTILYSYLMGVDAIDETICPEVLGMTKCSIA